MSGWGRAEKHLGALGGSWGPGGGGGQESPGLVLSSHAPALPRNPSLTFRTQPLIAIVVWGLCPVQLSKHPTRHEEVTVRPTSGKRQE